MKEMIKMVVVLAILSAFSGGVLAYIRDNTKERIEDQQLKFVKGPAINAIMEGSSNDAVASRFKIKDGELERTVFVGVFNGKVSGVALESFGGGYGGDVGVMAGINMDDDTLMGICVTTHAETPGLGSKAKDDPSFAANFKGLSLKEPVSLTGDGGKINAISGATISSRSVCTAVEDVRGIYNRLKAEIGTQARSVGK